MFNIQIRIKLDIAMSLLFDQNRIKFIRFDSQNHIAKHGYEPAITIEGKFFIVSIFSKTVKSVIV